MDTFVFDLDDTVDELRRGLVAYENAFVILRYYNRYGYTEHFRELIGEEGLIQQAKEAVRKFITWLKDKLHTLVRRLLVWIERNRINTMRRLLKSDNPTKLPYNLERINGYRANTFNNLPLPIDFKQYIADPTSIQTTMDEVVKRWKSVFEKTDEFEYDNEKILDVTSDMQASVERWSDRVKTMTNALDRYERSLKESLSPEELYRLTVEFANGCKYIIEYNFRYSDLVSDDDDPEQAFLVMKEHTTQVVRLITSGCDFITKLCSVGSNWYCDVKHIYDSTSSDIHVSIPFDQSMIRRLESHYGGSLKVRDLILTNTSPATWPTVKGVVHSRSIAWCYASDTNRNTFDLWVNVAYMNSKWSRLLDAFTHPDATNGRYRREDAFINHVVHECYHLYAA